MSRPTARLLLLGLAGVLVSTGMATLAARQAPATRLAAPPPAAVSPAGSGQVAAVNLTGDGVQATWVVRENHLPGSTNWRISGAPPTGFVAGFADRTYAAAGQSVRLYVSTSAPSFRVEAFRMGYYGGTGGRLVWTSPTYHGRRQPKCGLTAGVNLVSCANWSASTTMQVTDAFPQGDYLLKLVGSGNEQSYVPLTVWSPTSHATYLVKNDVFTWQAWNSYGGYDYYQGVGDCPSDVYPLCTRARIVSYDRPYADGHGSGEFLAQELPLVSFLEQHGLDVAYVDDLTVQQHPSVLSGHSALLSLGHDECWTLAERQAVTNAEGTGLNIAFFGASAVLRHVRTQPSPLGADRELVDYRDSASDPLNGHGDPRNVTGNTWAAPPASWPEDRFVGEAYNGFLEPGVHAAMTVTDPSAWIFAGTGLRAGASLANVIGSDVDSLERGDHPPNVQVLAHSALPVAQGQAGSHHGRFFYSDMTYYTDPTSQAGVWDSGTHNWVPAMAAPCRGSPCAADAVDRMTTNVLRLFGQGPAGRTRPAQPNWHTYYPG